MKAIVYLIISIHHTKAENEFFYLWGPNNLGYTKDVNRAGIYCTLPVNGQAQYKGESLHNTMRSLPVEVDGEEVERLQFKHTSEGKFIYNNAHNRHILGITIDGLGLKRGF